jgi:hypothetical protein
VIQTHRTLINLMEWQQAYSGIEPGQRYLQYASFGFDVSLQDVFFSLGYGGVLHVVNEAMKLDFAGCALHCYPPDRTLSLPARAYRLFGSELNSLLTGTSWNT